MEQGGVLPAGRRSFGDLTADHVRARIRAQGAPGRRRSPTGAERRGDHSLNPDLYPEVPLRQAAVLVPIVIRETGLGVLLTQRTDHLHDHAGQISFPGGRIEDFDRGPEQAALRETEEEVGLPPDFISLVGRLDTYVTRTGYEVVPCVGLVRAPYPVEIDTFEVADIFEVPLAFLVDPSNHRLESRVYAGAERFFYTMPYEGRYIWGATAGMIVNLSEVLRGEGA